MQPEVDLYRDQNCLGIFRLAEKECRKSDLADVTAPTTEFLACLYLAQEQVEFNGKRVLSF